MPAIGDRESLWQELCQVDLEGCATPYVQAGDIRKAECFLQGLPRPIVLLHTNGTNFPERKNLPASTASNLYRALLEQCDGTVVLLDWDYRVPLLAHGRIRHLKRDGGGSGLGELAALMSQSALLIGVDSGPYHFSSLTHIPTLGVFHDHYPWSVGLPRSKTVNMTRGDGLRALNTTRRLPWNVVEYRGRLPEAEDIAHHAMRMLQGPRYGIPLGRDIMLQQWVRDWCAGQAASFTDRHKTLDFLLRQCVQRFSEPTLVEDRLHTRP